MKKLSVTVASVAMLVATAASAQVIAQGTVPFYELFDGPALITVQKLTFAPGSGNAWHVHPGPVYAVVASGTLTEETGCGEVTVMHAGDAFTEAYPPDRVHRIVNNGTDPVVLISTVIKPPGTVATNFPAPLCGPPRDAGECKDGGWMRFQYPRSFEDQGDCVSYVNTGK